LGHGIFCQAGSLTAIKVHDVCADNDMKNLYEILGQQLDYFVFGLVLRCAIFN